jgi:hypothetical protein
VAISRPDRWFSYYYYYYWLDDARAPDFARTVEIHRKPAVCALDHPATRPAALAFAWLLAAPSKVRLDAARTNCSLRVVIVVALVETKVLRSTRPARRADDHGIERLADHPLVVD